MKEKKIQWYKKWKDWAKINLRINTNEWKEVLKMMASFNDIEYNQDLERGLYVYLKTIISNICREVLSIIKWDDSHVQGRSNLYQVLYV